MLCLFCGSLFWFLSVKSTLWKNAAYFFFLHFSPVCFVVTVNFMTGRTLKEENRAQNIKQQLQCSLTWILLLSVDLWKDEQNTEIPWFDVFVAVLVQNLQVFSWFEICWLSVSQDVWITLLVTEPLSNPECIISCTNHQDRRVSLEGKGDHPEPVCIDLQWCCPLRSL